MQDSLWTQIRRGILEGRACRRKLFVSVCIMIHELFTSHSGADGLDWFWCRKSASSAACCRKGVYVY